ncbi:ATP-dependent zinc metalloprotease FTSH 11, chloroplastic/mitochondrial [Asimina triloba]
MSAPQAAVLSRPPSFPSLSSKPCRFLISGLRLGNPTHPVVFFSCRRPRPLAALAPTPENPNSAAESSSFPGQDWISDLEKRDDSADFAVKKRSGDGDALAADAVALVEAETEKDGVRADSSDDGSGALTGKQANATEFSLAAFMMGMFFSLRKGFEKLAVSEWLSWWPFWRQEKRLERLLAEADANPKDAAKQTALLVELNKHSPESVIKRFEQRDHSIDSRGVTEYLRALVVTNAIAEYLPDEQSGRPSNLPTLVDPKASNKSARFAQELISTILFTVIVGLMWYVFVVLLFSLHGVMGAAALQKYVGSLGGIGASGVGSSSSYAPKELNKEVMPEKNVKTFKDVKGCDDAKQELEEVVEYLKNPSKFTRLGGKLPKGILLTGAPGTGKTLLAKAIAGEAGVPFFYRAGSEFEEMFVGVGARRVRSLFQAAKKKAPCIIFIDEIDAVGSTRKQWEGHTKKTLHQLLVEMDGFEQNEGIIVMAATNLPDILDPALTRPGRFDRHILIPNPDVWGRQEISELYFQRHAFDLRLLILVPNPDVRGRQEILELYLQDKPLADDVDVIAIARGTPGFNGADLANLVNIAAIKAAVEGVEKLNAAQLEFAKDRIIMGTERKTMFISEESKKLTAYHESGHAIVAFNTEGAHPIHKATIMPRGSALGMVTQLPSNDETSISKKQLLARLDVCMGGRVAEELIFGQEHITTGASSDLHQATELAQYMVSTCGMSDAVGPVYIKERPGTEMQSRIDAEVMRLLREAYDRVKSLLKKHEKALHALANALLEYETLTADDIKQILSPDPEVPLSEQQEELMIGSSSGGELQEQQCTVMQIIPVVVLWASKNIYVDLSLSSVTEGKPSLYDLSNA